MDRQGKPTGSNKPADAPSHEVASGTLSRSEIEFRLNSSTNQLLATLTPTQDAIAIPLLQLKNRPKEEGYGEFYFAEDALASLLVKAEKAVTGSFPIGEKRDAAVTVEIDSSKQAAYVDIAPSYGGEAITLQKLKQVLKSQSISDKCLLEEGLQKAVAQPSISHCCIAKAVPPQKGEDASFEALLEEKQALQLKEDDEGAVNFKEQFSFLVVEAGTPLMQRAPPTLGIPGIDVMGLEIEADPGQDTQFSKEASEGSQPDASNHNLLVSAIKGHPVIMPQGVKIDPTLIVKNVNITTGNIDFDGSVSVHGSVESGYEVKASGDVFVTDLVNKAKVIAGGNIVIAGGVIGEEQEDEEAKPKALLQAKGSISARYVNLAKIIAGSDIAVRESVIHSQIEAGGEIRLGQEGGKGCIIGGNSYAQNGVVANILGSEAYIPTTITAGHCGKLRTRLEILMTEGKRRHHERQQLHAILAKLSPNKNAPPLAGAMLEKVKKVAAAIKVLNKKLIGIKRIASQTKKELRLLADAYVDVKKKLYPNVTICIDGITEPVETEKRTIKLMRNGKKLEAAV